MSTTATGTSEPDSRQWLAAVTHSIVAGVLEGMVMPGDAGEEERKKEATDEECGEREARRLVMEERKELAALLLGPVSMRGLEERMFNVSEDAIVPETLIGQLPRSRLMSTADGFWQAQVVTQRGGERNSCGYYALFNAETALLASQARTKRERAAILSQLGDMPAFWRSYWRHRKALQAHAAALGGDSYPWCEDVLASGAIEREFMLFLLERSEMRRHLTSLPEMSIFAHRNGVMQLSQLKQLRRLFDRLADGSRSVSHAFMLGAFTHWVCLLVHRDAGCDTEFLLLDSNSLPVFGMDHDDAMAVTGARLAPYLEAGLYDEATHKRKQAQWVQSIADRKHACRAIAAGVNGGGTGFITFILDQLVQGLLHDFVLHALRPQAQEVAAHLQEAGLDAEHEGLSPPALLRAESSHVGGKLLTVDASHLVLPDASPQLLVKHLLAFLEYSPPAVLRGGRMSRLEEFAAEALTERSHDLLLRFMDVLLTSAELQRLLAAPRSSAARLLPHVSAADARQLRKFQAYIVTPLLELLSG